MPPISDGVVGRSVTVMLDLPSDGRGHRRTRGADGLHDVHVPRATADVPRDRPAHVVVGRVVVVLEECRGDEHHPGRAEAALKSVRFLERDLYRVQAVGALQPLDGRELTSVGLYGE